MARIGKIARIKMGKKGNVKLQLDAIQTQKLKAPTKLLPGYSRHTDGSIRKIKDQA